MDGGLFLIFFIHLFISLFQLLVGDEWEEIVEEEESGTLALPRPAPPSALAPLVTVSSAALLRYFSYLNFHLFI